MNELFTLFRPTTPTEMWTLVAAVGTWALFIGALIGLRSLKLTKTAMQLEDERRKKETALKQIEIYAQQIHPNLTAYFASLNKRGLAMPMEVLQVAPGPKQQEMRVAAARKWLAHVTPELHRAGLQHLDALESWSMYVRFGLADEKIVLFGCGRAYCEAMDRLLAFLVNERAPTGRHDSLESAAHLHARWEKMFEDAEQASAEFPTSSRTSLLEYVNKESDISI